MPPGQVFSSVAGSMQAEALSIKDGIEKSAVLGSWHFDEVAQGIQALGHALFAHALHCPSSLAPDKRCYGAAGTIG